MIHIVSHGPACLDGTAAAAAIARFFRGERVKAQFPANSESDRAIQRIKPRGQGHQLWITDLSWTSEKTADHLKRLAAAGSAVFWIDHHRTALSRQSAPEFQVPLAGKMLSEEFSAARLVFDFLKNEAARLAPGARADIDSFAEIAAIADDHDRWVHRIDGSEDWALAVQTIGARNAFREMVKLRRPVMNRVLKQALEIGRHSVRRSADLARATMSEYQLPAGGKLRTACCFGYSSEAAAELYKDQSNTLVALLDLRSRGVSLRRSADCPIDLAKLAEKFGGGGHAAAAGFELDGLDRALGQELGRSLGQRIAELL